MLWESMILSTALAAIALLKQAITPWGTALAWVLCMVITYFGGIPAFVILATLFAFTIIAEKAAGKRSDPNGVRRKSGKRDSTRVFCNVGIGTVAMLLFGITEKQAFSLAYVAVMSASLADSLASKLGPLSKHQPVDICNFRPISTGLSGGVSFAGTMASLLGGVLIGAVYLAFYCSQPANSVLIALCGLFGSVIDSIFGSAVQIKYICPKCQVITERQEHCGVSTKRFKGIHWVNNDVVNFLSNVLVFILALLIFK